ncbi:MAG: hypothetical protein M3373_13950 [Gemmatimonadota bacterium]|nr:hypothetical protein [Gemmatimonadota bacterium]
MLGVAPSARAAAVVVAIGAWFLGGACARGRAVGSGQSGVTERGDLIEVEYDRNADSIFVRTVTIPLAGGLELYAGFAVRDAAVPEPAAVVNFVFQQVSAREQWSEAQGRSLTLVLDDTVRIAFAETEYRRHVLEGRGAVTLRVIEWIWVPIPATTFERLASAAKVEGTLDRTRFVLTSEHLAAMRELARRLSRNEH